MSRGLFLALAAGAALGALPPAAGAYRAGPPAGHTGGFGEVTCWACHWSEAEEPGTGLSIDLPASYQPGKSYDIVIELRDSGLAVAGFQLAARFEGGAAPGAQAGVLAPADSTVSVVTAAAGVMYASQSPAGAQPRSPGVARWRVRWTAPPEGGTVVFHAAGNAANDDLSEYGDRIHAAEARATSR